MLLNLQSHTHFYMSCHEEKIISVVLNVFFWKPSQNIANWEPFSKEIQLPPTDNRNICSVGSIVVS